MRPRERHGGVQPEQMPLQHPPDHLVRHQQRPPHLSPAHRIQRASRPDIGVGVAFPTGKPPPVLVIGPELPLTGEQRIDLRIDQATEPTVVNLGKLIDDVDPQPQAVPDDARRCDGSAERTDEDPVNPTPLQHRRVPMRLLDTRLRQRRIEPTLPPALQVPLRLTMPSKEHRFPRVHAYSLAVPTTNTPPDSRDLRYATTNTRVTLRPGPDTPRLLAAVPLAYPALAGLVVALFADEDPPDGEDHVP